MRQFTSTWIALIWQMFDVLAIKRAPCTHRAPFAHCGHLWVLENTAPSTDRDRALSVTLIKSNVPEMCLPVANENSQWISLVDSFLLLSCFASYLPSFLPRLAGIIHNQVVPRSYISTDCSLSPSYVALRLVSGKKTLQEQYESSFDKDTRFQCAYESRAGYWYGSSWVKSLTKLYRKVFTFIFLLITVI